MKKEFLYLLAGFLGATSLYIMTSFVIDSSSVTNPALATDSVIVRRIEAVNGLPHQTCLPIVPSELSLFGENIPLNRQDVYESLDREILTNTFWHTNFILILKRSQRIFDIIEPILKEEGVPEDFKYLAVAESSLVPTIKSPAGAVGLWQILESTGKELGLEINDEVDQRYDIELSTRAACKFLKRSFDSLGSWMLVAAAYNGGQARVNKQMSSQYQKSYFDILWAEETARYVFRIAAFKVILDSPSDYGFLLTDDVKYVSYPCRVMMFDGSIADIAQFAIDNGTTYKALKNLNPWLRQNKLTNAKKKEYKILIPE